MAFVLVTSVSAGATSDANITTAGVDTTGATLIVLNSVRFQGSESAPTDSKGNTWTITTTYGTTSAFSTLYWCVNPTVGAGHTFTGIGTGSRFPSICMMAFTGNHLSSPYGANVGASGAIATSIQPGSITPSEDNMIVIEAYSHSSPFTNLAINSGFTLQEQQNHVNSQHIGSALAYLVQTTATAVNPTWTWTTNSSALAASQHTFKVPAAGGGGTGAKVMTGRAMNSLAMGRILGHHPRSFDEQQLAQYEAGQRARDARIGHVASEIMHRRAA